MNSYLVAAGTAVCIHRARGGRRSQTRSFLEIGCKFIILDGDCREMVKGKRETVISFFEKAESLKGNGN